jgi:hypothetical protein
LVQESQVRSVNGGVTQALNIDSHGKTLSYRLLGLSIAVPDGLVWFARRSAQNHLHNRAEATISGVDAPTP